MSETHEHPNYVKIWYWLLVLLAISVAGPMLEVPALTLITAFGIAIIKSFLVAANYMHLKFEKKNHLALTHFGSLSVRCFLFWNCSRYNDDRGRSMDRLYCG